MQVLIDAVIRLLERRGPAEISCRDIAAEAGVNHGLVHHYFGSKEALIHEAAAQTAERMVLAHPPGVRISWSFDYLRANPGLARVIARVCLDGPKELLRNAAGPREVLEQRRRAVAEGLERLGLAGAVDPAVLTAAGTAAMLGWIVFRPLLEEAGYELPADADAQFAGVLGKLDAMFGAPEADAGRAGR